MGISFNEVVKNNLISEKAVKLLNNRCKCGCELEFSDSLKELKCTNPNCKAGIVGRITNMFSLLGIEYDDNYIYTIVDKLDIVTPYQMFILRDVVEQGILDINIVPELESLIQKLEEIKLNEYFIYQIVRLCGIEEITKVAYRLFYGFEELDDALDEIETGQVAFINERLGVKSSEGSVLSVEIYNILLSLKEELIFAESQFKIKKYDRKIIRIAFADGTSPFVNRGELLDYLNNTYNYIFLNITTIKDNTDILVRNFDNTSNKLRAAQLINDKFVANKMNNGEISLDDIDKLDENSYKPIGSKVYIDNLENVIKALDRMKGIDV